MLHEARINFRRRLVTQRNASSPAQRLSLALRWSQKPTRWQSDRSGDLPATLATERAFPAAIAGD